MCYIDERMQKYIKEQCEKYKVEIIKTDKLTGSCLAASIVYEDKRWILIDSRLKGKRYVFSILHELSHFSLNYLGAEFEKKASTTLSEKMVNLNLVWMNRKLLYKRWLFIYFCLAIISEELLFNKIVFKGGIKCIN